MASETQIARLRALRKKYKLGEYKVKTEPKKPATAPAQRTSAPVMRRQVFSGRKRSQLEALTPERVIGRFGGGSFREGTLAG